MQEENIKKRSVPAAGAHLIFLFAFSYFLLAPKPFISLPGQ